MEGDAELHEMVLGTVRRIWLDYACLATENQRLRDMLSLFLDLPATSLVERIEQESAEQCLELVALALGHDCYIDQRRHLVVEVGPDKPTSFSSFLASLTFFLGATNIDIEPEYRFGDQHLPPEPFRSDATPQSVTFLTRSATVLHGTPG